MFFHTNQTRAPLLILSAFVVLLSACGGGSEDQIPQAPPPIQVSANIDITVDEQSQVDIQGAATGGEGSLSFAWQVPDELRIEHPNPSVANATVITPILRETRSFELTLVVTDSAGGRATDAFILTVQAVNVAPVAAISINSLDNYQTGEYPVNAQVVLDGSVSFDQDADPSEPAIARYRWRQIEGIDILADVASNNAELVFTTPINNQVADLRFELEVTDQEGATSIAQADVRLLGQAGTLPFLHIENTDDAFAGERILLNADAGSDAPAALPLTYQWTILTAVDGAILDSASSAASFLTLPAVDSPSEVTVEVTIEDRFGNQLSEQIGIGVAPGSIQRLNDTGITLHANAQRVEAGDFTDFAGQDADFGRDRVHESGLLDKAGEGLNGFDFTKLNANGDPLDADAPTWRCVRDNVSGLVWEIKTQEAGSLHQSEQRFTWFASENNGDFVGELNQGSQACNVASQACNTEAFIEEVNNQGLCGFFDWRLPSHAELHSLVHYGQLDAPKADTTFFPFWGAVQTNPLNYWTSQSSADGVGEDGARNAWAINFDSGIDSFLNKNSLQYLRLVRAGRGIE